jgi:hypothetical protein
MDKINFLLIIIALISWSWFYFISSLLEYFLSVIFIISIGTLISRRLENKKIKPKSEQRSKEIIQEVRE